MASIGCIFNRDLVLVLLDKCHHHFTNTQLQMCFIFQ